MPSAGATNLQPSIQPAFIATTCQPLAQLLSIIPSTSVTIPSICLALITAGAAATDIAYRSSHCYHQLFFVVDANVFLLESSLRASISYDKELLFASSPPTPLKRAIKSPPLPFAPPSRPPSLQPSHRPQDVHLAPLSGRLGSDNDELLHSGTGFATVRPSVRNGPGQPEGFQAGFDAAGPCR
ncbi:hypothetical protein BDD12DRAFT_897883 [Trichophaea hybrida]|nr:hypothetical protein BDD12DRAFT_897883 [Trichophaea hybrida]